MSRSLVFQIHMWIGLALGIALAVLGLSGSLLVYDDAIAAAANPPPRAIAQGRVLPLDRMLAIGRKVAGAQNSAVTLTPPQDSGDAVQLRFGSFSVMGAMAGMPANAATDIFLDPVSGAVLAVRPASQPGILTFAHQLHGNFLMGRGGRRFVGWLGLGMFLLGVSGLVLWWPKRGQWRYAFGVRRTATGLRFHRELHAMLGIWGFFVLLVVSFSGLVLAWPQTMGAAPAAATPHIAERVDIAVDRAVAAAKAALPKARLVSVALRPGQPVSVNFLSNGAIAASVLVDPAQNKVLSVRDPSESFAAWQRPVHQGTLGRVWKFLVFLCGLLPAIFVTTGIAMWTGKRRRRMTMTAPLDT